LTRVAACTGAPAELRRERLWRTVRLPRNICQILLYRVLIEARLIRFVGARNHSHKGRMSGDFEVNPVVFEAKR